MSTFGSFAQIEDAIIQVLLKNGREKGRHAYMRGADIGREIGTYRRHTPSSDDPFGRVHRYLLNKLQDEGRAEPLWSESGKKRIGWRLTDAEWNRLILAEVVKDIIESMSETDKANFLNTAEEDLIQFHHDWGRDIRNRYNLWQDTELVKATGTDYPDDASGVIIKAVWKALPRPPQVPHRFVQVIIKKVWKALGGSK